MIKNKKKFDPPKIIVFTKKVNVIMMEENYCIQATDLNSLECHICSELVGSDRPIGMAWVTTEFNTKPHGCRMCNRCYNIAKS
jgi:hypothetical protein